MVTRGKPFPDYVNERAAAVLGPTSIIPIVEGDDTRQVEYNDFVFPDPTDLSDALVAGFVGDSNSDTAVALDGQYAPGIHATTYGVVADGTTDDTAAWVAAIAAADAAALPLYAPIGTSIVSGLDLPDGFTLIGRGINSGLKLKASTARSVLGLASVTTQGVTVRNLVIDGNKANQSSTLARGLNFVNQDASFLSPWQTYLADAYHHVSDVKVINCKGTGVYVAGRGDSHFVRVESYQNDVDGFYVAGFDLWFTDCISGQAGGYGFHLPGYNNTFTGCKAFMSGVDDFMVAGSYCRFSNCVSQGAYRHGFVLYLSNHCVVSSLMVIDSDYEHNAVGNCINIDGGSRHIISATVAGIEVGPTPQYGVYFNAASPGSQVDVTADATDFVLALVGGTTTGARVRTNGSEGYAITTYASIVAPDMSAAWRHKITLTGNITINRPTNSRNGDMLTMIFQQDATGSRTVTWGSGFPDKTWTPTTAANSVSVAQFVHVDNNFYRMT